MNELSFSSLPIGARFRLKKALTAAGRLVEWVKVDDNTAESDGQSLSIRWSVKCLLPPYGEDPNRGRERRKQADRRARLDEAAYKFDFPTIDNLARALLDGEYEVVKVIEGSES